MPMRRFANPLHRLTVRLVEDTLNATDEEILEEAREEGIDTEAHAAEMRGRFERVVAERKQRDKRHDQR